MNRPLLKTLIGHYFTIKGLSRKSLRCTKIEHICLIDDRRRFILMTILSDELVDESVTLNY